MHCTTMLIISIAVHNYAYHKQFNSMHCTYMPIICHLLPMHCTTLLIISNAVHNYAYHKQFNSNALHTMLIISNYF